ncbi:phosphoglycolate phosphatase [Thauera linaloolentis]|uniref:Phosphoglycolate phosphatase n=1 Tax=Thauera linaloolentis (strain DSM 12138 / JCM 21573 / CCUG 41526 / CIP 105981 / IAM 15112 / NBRC 102519 / 47Lol) TaxID=1123367 RepID=N6YXF7_THAL4|nr:phosphoglycolate phosphatase [Thauera linaloolentis]ENO84629.1 phosphoglycolate phosphatase [Thauera linaloolentis 47Lol = DSM 12138]MCM8564262.1 phosphoglycolate phosphatase [Thauera linaloolentis]
MSVVARFTPRAVLFDLDGTLLDTIADLAEAANLMLAELGRPQRGQDEIHRFVGKGIPNLVRRCMTENAAATEAEVDTAVAAFRRHYTVVNGMRAAIYPGVEDTLQGLRARGIRLAVVTNKAEAFTLPLLERMGIAGHFDTVVSGDTLPVKKPDPATLRLACERLGVVPAEALMIGDSANDALAAQGAGMPVLLVTYGYSEGVPVDTIECDGLLSNALQALDHIAPSAPPA